MLVVAFGMVDQWSRAPWRQLRAGSRDRDALWSLSIVVIVCAITVVFGFVPAIAVGVLLSLVLFVAALNRSLVRSVATGETRGSRRIYDAERARVLRERGAQIRVVELEGAIFFGTALRLRNEMETLAAGARFFILDVRRVTMIDASGANALDRLASRLAQAGVAIAARRAGAGPAPRARAARLRRVRARGRPALVSRRRPRARIGGACAAGRGGRAAAARRVAARRASRCWTASTGRSASSCGRC